LTINELHGPILGQKLEHGLSFSKDYRPKTRPLFIDPAKFNFENAANQALSHWKNLREKKT
jgi:hypothetical protein